MHVTAISSKETTILKENKRVVWEEFEGGKERGNDMIFIILKSKVLVKSLYLVVIDYINI